MTKFETNNDLRLTIKAEEKEILVDEVCCTSVNIILKNDGQIMTSFLGAHNPEIMKNLERALKAYFKGMKKALKAKYSGHDCCCDDPNCHGECHDHECHCHDEKHECTCGDNCTCGHDDEKHKKSKKDKHTDCGCGDPNCTCGDDCHCHEGEKCSDSCTCADKKPNSKSKKCGCGEENKKSTTKKKTADKK